MTRSEALKHQAGYPTLQLMVEYGTPLTREEFIRSNWMGEPEEWTAEHEAEVPPPLRID